MKKLLLALMAATFLLYCSLCPGGLRLSTNIPPNPLKSSFPGRPAEQPMSCSGPWDPFSTSMPINSAPDRQKHSRRRGRHRYTEAMKAKADGYRIVATATPMITKIHMSNVKNSAPPPLPRYIMIADNPCFLLVHKDSPYKDVRDYIADAKKRPGQINMGNAGAGGGYHLASLAFQSFAGIKLNHIPFEGGGPSITALMGKHVDSIIVSAPEGVPQALAGDLRLLGIFGDERLEKFPTVPTAKELGINFKISMWRGVHAPKDTPPAILSQLHDIFKKCLADGDFKKKCDELGVQIKYLNSEDYGKFMLSEDARYKELIMKEKLGERYK